MFAFTTNKLLTIFSPLVDIFTFFDEWFARLTSASITSLTVWAIESTFHLLPALDVNIWIIKKGISIEMYFRLGITEVPQPTISPNWLDVIILPHL